MSELEWVENPNAPVIYADDVGAVEIVGDRVRITFYEVRTIAGKMVKSPVVEIIRPLASAGAAAFMVAQAIREAGNIVMMMPN